MRGGAADKAGNRYEHLWLVLRVSEMLEGRVSRIRLEPLGETGRGIEFVLDAEGVAWAEQTKNEALNWTIRGLIQRGVLAAAKHQIDLGRHYRFVTSSAAEHLATLAYRAGRSESFAEFEGSLGSGRRIHLDEVATEWGVSSVDAWPLLQRVEVAHMPLAALEKVVAATLRRLFVDEPDRVVEALHSFCAERVHGAFTAPQVCAYLESNGLQRRLIIGDSNAINKLRGTCQRQRHRVECAEPAIGLVPRDDVDTVREMLRGPDGAQIVVVDGRAGSGKSTVVSTVAAGLEAEGWFVAVARMDSAIATPTSGHLGQAIGLDESPSVLLAGVSDGSPALLVVDQLDAVSTYSGRMSDNFQAVHEIVAEIERTPNVKVLLVVRSVDLESDPRLGSLLRSRDSVDQHTIGDLDIDAVKAQIAGYGMQLPTSDSTLELLRRPLQLSVFSRLSESAREDEYATLQDLYRIYTKEVRNRVEARVGSLDWDAITGAVVRYMSDHEVLAAPAGVLDLASSGEVEALLSESVVVSDGDSVAFFHESFFDYLFARAFVAAGRDLRDFLVESGQHLFRRAQTRQVLEHLVATDRRRFITVAAGLLGCDEVRYHLKGVVVRVLRQAPPTVGAAEDWMAFEELAWSGSPIGYKLLRLLNQPGWFDAVDSLGRWEKWLNDPERAERAFRAMALCAKDRPVRVAELVRPHIDESEDWRQRLGWMLSWSLCSGLVNLTIELIELGHFDDLRGPLAANSDFWSLLYGLENEDPAGAARLVGAFLCRGLARARQDGAEDPFGSGHLSPDSRRLKSSATLLATRRQSLLRACCRSLSRSRWSASASTRGTSRQVKGGRIGPRGSTTA